MHEHVADTGCWGKLSYPNRAEARAHLIGLIIKSKRVGSGRRPKKGRTLNVYRCRECGHFHVGHSPKRPPPR